MNLTIFIIAITAFGITSILLRVLHTKFEQYLDRREARMSESLIKELTEALNRRNRSQAWLQDQVSAGEPPKHLDQN